MGRRRRPLQMEGAIYDPSRSSVADDDDDDDDDDELIVTALIPKLSRIAFQRQ